MNIYVSRGGHFLNQYYLLPKLLFFFTQNQIMCKLLYSYDDVYMHERNRLALSKTPIYCSFLLFFFLFYCNDFSGAVFLKFGHYQALS